MGLRLLLRSSMGKPKGRGIMVSRGVIHRRTQDFTLEGVHRWRSVIFRNGSSQGVSQKLKQKC